MSRAPAAVRGRTREPWAREYNLALAKASDALARRATSRLAVATAPLPVVLSTAWVALVRFTMVELPIQVAFVFPALWFFALVLYRATRRVGRGEAARHLDIQLGLDERVSTSLEMLRSAPVAGLQTRRPPLLRSMLEDTAHHLKLRKVSLRSGWHLRISLRQLTGLALACLPLAGALVIPTALDKVRAERARLREAVATEIARIEQLKAELVDRAGLADVHEYQINAELDRLAATLQSTPLDRAALLAAMADSQVRLQGLSQDASSDFFGVLAAGRTVQNAAATLARGTGTTGRIEDAWDPEAVADLPELAKAADAAHYMSRRTESLDSAEMSAVAASMERAEGQAAQEDPALAQELLDASHALGARDPSRSATKLRAVADRFDDLARRLELSKAVEQSLSQIDEGRQALAEGAVETSKKGQVGFRRPGTGPSPVPATPNQDDVAGGVSTPTEDERGVNADSPSAFGPGLGMNSPDFSSSQSGQPGGQSVAGSGDGQAQAGASGQDGQQGSGIEGGSAGGSAGGGTGSERGTLSGAINGPVGGSGGAISYVPNPEGQGVAQETSGGAGAGGDEVYVPGGQEVSGAEANVVENSAAGGPTTDAPRTEGIEGHGDGNGEAPVANGQRGAGIVGELKTPYKRVLGEYAKEAASALEGAYIPADAKQYVKEYFTQLGK